MGVEQQLIKINPNWNSSPNYDSDKIGGFYGGRDEDLKQLSNWIVNSSGGSVLVSGVRGVGKTSFVYRAINKASSLELNQRHSYIFGLLSDNRKRTNQMLKFNPTNDTLTEIDGFKGDIPSDRSGITPLVYSDHLYIYGGYGTNAERFNDLYSFNFITKTWKFISTTGQFPVKTSGQCGVKYEAFIYIFGGSYGGDSSGSYSKQVLTYTNNFYKYDLTSHIWKRLECKNCPSPRSFSEAFVYQDILYM